MNAGAGMLATSAPVSAVAVAERGRPSMADSSPRTSPAVSTSSTTSWPPTVWATFSSPLRTTSTSWASSPSKNRIDWAG
jgi:hypothetical protein